MTATLPNEPSADNAGGFRGLAYTKPANDGGKEKKQQVNPALRLPAGRYGLFINMKRLLTSCLIVLTFWAYGQNVKDTVFIKFNISEHSLKYKTDTLLFPSEMRRNMIFGTSPLPSSSNQYTAYWTYGLYFEKAESSDCLEQTEGVEDLTSKITDIFLNDSIWTFKIHIAENCCYSFLCDITVVKESTLQLDYFGYGQAHCDCDCFYDLTYNIKRADFKKSGNIKYVVIANNEKSLKKINKP